METPVSNKSLFNSSIHPANEGVNAANYKHSLARLDLSSMGTNSNKVVMAGFNTDQKSQCLHILQAGFGYAEAFRYLSMSAIVMYSV